MLYGDDDDRCPTWQLSQFLRHRAKAGLARLAPLVVVSVRMFHQTIILPFVCSDPISFLGAPHPAVPILQVGQDSGDLPLVPTLECLEALGCHFPVSREG